MHDRIRAAHQLKRCSGVGEVGPDIAWRALLAPVVGRRLKIGTDHLVAVSGQLGYRRASYLAVCPGDDDAHQVAVATRPVSVRFASNGWLGSARTV